MKVCFPEPLYFVDYQNENMVIVKLRNGQSFIDQIVPMEGLQDFIISKRFIQVGKNIFFDNAEERTWDRLTLNGNGRF